MNLTDARDTIVQEITIKGSAERIFEALTNPDQRVKWWGAEGRFQTTQIRPNERGSARASRLAADSDVAASIRGGPPPRARLTLHLGFPRTAVYFLPLSALNISKPSAGLRFLCTTAWTALIIACGASDWKMLRPMSTPAAPCRTAL